MNSTFDNVSMVKRVLSVFIALTVSFSTYGQSSLLKRLEKKVQHKVEDQATKRAERKLDDALDNALDKAEGSLSNLGKNKDGTPIQVAEHYQFDLGIRYELKSNQKGKQEKMPSTTLWFGRQPYMGMSTDAQQSMFMVMDNGHIITFLPDSKTYMAMSGAALGSIVSTSESKDTEYEPQIRQVGNESILGQSCKVFEVIDDDHIMRIWISDLNGNTQSFMSAFAQMAKAGNLHQQGMKEMEGIALKVLTTHKKTNDITEMVAVELLREGKKFSTTGYKTMSF
jgi:hypothetical protein